jgi:hypothetical protein
VLPPVLLSVCPIFGRSPGSAERSRPTTDSSGKDGKEETNPQALHALIVGRKGPALAEDAEFEEVSSSARAGPWPWLPFLAAAYTDPFLAAGV